jgi:hypothetical protein
MPPRAPPFPAAGERCLPSLQSVCGPASEWYLVLMRYIPSRTRRQSGTALVVCSHHPLTSPDRTVARPAAATAETILAMHRRRVHRRRARPVAASRGACWQPVTAGAAAAGQHPSVRHRLHPASPGPARGTPPPAAVAARPRSVESPRPQGCPRRRSPEHAHPGTQSLTARTCARADSCTGTAPTLSRLCRPRHGRHRRSACNVGGLAVEACAPQPKSSDAMPDGYSPS